MFFESELKDIEQLESYAKRFTLLTKEQELELLHLFHDSLKALNTVFSSNVENKEYLMIFFAKQKDHAATQLVTRNIRLVITKAKKFMHQGLPLLDLVQEGLDGVLHTIEKWDFSKNVKFSTYATIWIEQRIRRAIDDKGRMIKVPNNKVQLLNKIRKVTLKHVIKYGEPPTSEEISETLASFNPPIFLTSQEIEEYGRLMHPSISLDEPTGDDEHLTLVDYIADSNTILPEDQVEISSDKEYVYELLSKLEDDERKFIMYKFGFLDYKTRTNKEMCLFSGLSPKEVREKEIKILEKLNRIANINRLNYLVD